MQKLRNLSLLLTLLMLIGCSAPHILQSQWLPKDTNTSEVFNQTPAVYLFPKDQISLKIFNNQEQLDLIFETNSPFTIEKIIRLGMSVWIDPSGKKGKELGVHFPLPLEDQKSISVNFDSETITNNQLNRIYQDLREAELVNFVKEETLIISKTEQEEGVTVELYSLDNKLFRYHLSLNLKRIIKGNKTTEANHNLSIGISSVNEPDVEYYSALSSRKILQKKMEQLKAGERTEVELTEHWVNFQLAMP